LWTTDQGENNCADTPGNSATKSGYGCEMAALVASWREIWSAESGTTDPEAPFGIVSLASGGSEGHDEAIGGLRWSQSGNYGTLPNELMKKTFLAHAYDLGDPMDNLHPPCINQTTAAPNASAFADGTCVWPAPNKWNQAVAPLRDTVQQNKAPSFMGGIHPRFKHEVGRRLALAYRGALSPTIKGCTVKSASEVDLVMLVAENDHAIVQWSAADSNMSNWGVKDSSGLMVCLQKPGADTLVADCLSNADLWVSAPLVSSACSAAMQAACGGNRSDVFACAQCSGEHQRELQAAGCSKDRKSVV
jgi:hypothetical protein